MAEEDQSMQSSLSQILDETADLSSLAMVNADENFRTPPAQARLKRVPGVRQHRSLNPPSPSSFQLPRCGVGQTQSNANAHPIGNFQIPPSSAALPGVPSWNCDSHRIPLQNLVEPLHSSMTFKSPHSLDDYQIFSSPADVGARRFLQCLEKLYSTSEEIDLVEITGSGMRMKHEEECLSWKNLFGRVRNFQRTLPTGHIATSQWYCSDDNGRLAYHKRESSSFLLFLEDFFLGYDSEKDLLGFFCPLSGFFEVRQPDLCFDDLINDWNDAQVHFIARRLVQLTGLSWNWDCLAKFEQNLPCFEFLATFTTLLSGVDADIEFSPLEHLVGFKVGLIEEHDGPGAYRVGLEARGTTFCLKSIQDGAVHVPEAMSSAILMDGDEAINMANICVGGIHDLNLAYYPKNRDFKDAKEKKFKCSVAVRDAFLAFGYGKCLSEVLASKAFSMLETNTTVSLISVQISLLRGWKIFSDRSMIPLTFRRKIRKRSDIFLVRQNGELKLARSTKNISKSCTLGLNTNFAQVSLAVQSTPKPIFDQTRVVSIYDAVGHLLGVDELPGFKKVGNDWYKPTRSGMSSISGPHTFLHYMLAGKVNPYGMFESVVPRFPPHPALQWVCFDIPLPYGLAYLTHALGLEPVKAAAKYLYDFHSTGLDRWECRVNYAFPAVVGGPFASTAVRDAFFPRAAKDRKNAEKKQVDRKKMDKKNAEKK